jgi:tetratricopeptide (TPR) repeat protein
MRGVSVALAELSLEEESIKYATRGLEMMEPGSSPLRFYLTRSVSMSQAALGNHEEAVRGVDNAINTLPANWRDDEELIDTVKWIYDEKAGYLNNYLDRPEDAIQAYFSLNRVTPEKTQDGLTLDDMAGVWNGDRDPGGTKLLALLKEWTEKERLSWFEWMLQVHYAPSIERFDQICAQNGQSSISQCLCLSCCSGGSLLGSAQTQSFNQIVVFGGMNLLIFDRTGEEGKTFLLQCYNNYISTIPNSSDKILLPQIALANSYRTVIKDQQKAKEAYMVVLKRNIKDINIRSFTEGHIFQTRRDLAEIIFEEFLESSDGAKKEKLLEEMKSFPSQRTELSDVYQFEGSNVSVMVSLMTRVVGRPADFQVRLCPYVKVLLLCRGSELSLNLEDT